MPHLDLSYIINNVSSDNSFIVELLNVFLTSLQRDIPPLQEAIEAEDHVQIRKSAHKIKSGFRSLGMQDMTTFLQELEDKGKNEQSIDDIRSQFEGFMHMLPAVKAELMMYIKQHEV